MLDAKEIKDILAQNNVSEICLQFFDIDGKIKSLYLQTNQIDKILAGEVELDYSSLPSHRENKTLDLRIIPDVSTFLVIPLEIIGKRNIARFICDIKNVDNTDYTCCTRTNLKRIIQKAEELDYKMKIGPEIEFFLFKCDKEDIPQLDNTEKTGYYETQADPKYDTLILKIFEIFEAINLDIDGFHHEGAPFQHEIDLKYDDILKTADKLLTFKFTLKIIAQSFGYKASFMPKPIYSQNGSGLHLNISITNKNEKNIFYNEDKKYQLSDAAMHSIGGLLKNIKGITAVLNPTINSYKRLVKDYEAPIYVVWSVVTRSALIRIPTTRGETTRLELRSPDFSCNPYMAFATILQTCLDGIRNQIDSPTPMEKNLFALSSNEIKQRKIKSLPRNMYTALEEFEKSLCAKAALGEEIYTKFLYLKRVEWNEYRKQVSPWELDNYLDI